MAEAGFPVNRWFPLETSTRSSHGVFKPWSARGRNGLLNDDVRVVQGTDVHARSDRAPEAMEKWALGMECLEED